MFYIFIHAQLSYLSLLVRNILLRPTKTNICYYPVIQPLLFWQSLFLVSLIGIIAIEFQLYAFVASLIFLWIDSRYWKWNTFSLFIICIMVGSIVGILSKPKEPQYTPIWLAQCLEKHKPIKITGTIERVQGVPGNRLQFILKNVYPVSFSQQNEIDNISNQKIVILPSQLLWTWENPTINREMILPGQKVTITVIVRPIKGFRNKGSYNIANYWYRQNIYFQAWSKGSTVHPIISGKPHFSSWLRGKLYHQFIQCIQQTSNINQQPITTKQPTILHLPPEKSFIPALLFGDRFFLSHTLNEVTRYTGLAHSLALSGQHLAVISIASITIIIVLIKISPCFFLSLPRYKAIPLFSLPFALLYLWIGGAPPSLLRATIMLFIWSSYLIQNKSICFLDIAIIALICLILFDPQGIYHIGIQLSFLSVLSISFFNPLLQECWRAIYKRISTTITPEILYSTITTSIKIIIFTIGTTLIVQICTLPLCLYVFGYIPIWFPLNIIWLPILGIFVLPLAFVSLLFCSLQCTSIGILCINLAQIPCEILIRLLVNLKNAEIINPIWLPRPSWAMLLGCYLILLSIGIKLGRTGFTTPAKRILLAGVILVVTPLFFILLKDNSNKIRLRIMDVGQGQAILIEWGKNKRALIDAGGFYSNRLDTGRDILAPILSTTHSLHLDFFAISHPHRDHIKGFLFLANVFNVDQVYSAILPTIDCPKGNASPLLLQLDTILKNKHIPRKALIRGEQIPLSNDIYLEVLSPPKGVIPKGNTGLILRLVAKNHGLAFLPGDAELNDLKELLKTNLEVRSEVLILPHHGSKSSFLPELYKKINPTIAVASTGTLNANDFPSTKVHNALLQYDIPLKTTAEEGELTFEWDLDKLH